jgi:hypothetical protein
MRTAEVEQIELWRVDRFVRLGFNGEQVAALLEASVDAHEAERLVVAGCPHELVVSILT